MDSFFTSFLESMESLVLKIFMAVVAIGLWVGLLKLGHEANEDAKKGNNSTTYIVIIIIIVIFIGYCNLPESSR
jgi:hypothetical protein